MKPTEWLSEGDRRACSNTGHSQDGGWLPPSSTPTPIHLLSNMPTRHGPAPDDEEEGGIGAGGIEGWRWRFGSVRGRRGGGCLYQSVTGWQLTPVPAVATGNWPEPGQSWPAVCACVSVCVRVSVFVCARAFQPLNTHIYTSHLPSNSSHILLTISLPLSLSQPPQPVHDILQVNQSVSASWHESTAFIQSTPCLSYLLKYFYLNWPSNQSTFLPL